MNYAEISKETISFLYKSYTSLKNSPLESSIKILVELRISQINRCAYCCKLHTDEARALGISQEKIDVLPAWHNSKVFTEKEIVALQWAEELTCLNKDGYESIKLLEKYFSERQIVDLTACISIMNSLNRIAISLRD